MTRRTSFLVYGSAVSVALAVSSSPAESQGYPFSQRGIVTQNVAFTEISVSYGRPVARGRELFGALVPWDAIWHPGADSATRITFSHDVLLEGKPMPAGEYSLWLIPRERAPWTLILSRAARVFHLPYPGIARDALRIDVTPEQVAHMESFAIYFPKVLRDDAVMRLHWGTTALPIRIKAPFRRRTADAAVSSAAAQTAGESQTPVSVNVTAKADSVASSAERLRVFLDCDECDFDFIRTEVSFVDYVRSRQDAQVHILATRQVTGGGGQEYTLTFIGQRELATLTDTLRHVSPQAASEDDLRRALARIIKLGLVRYATRIGQAASFDVTYNAVSPSGGAKGAAAGGDRWNFWVFRTSASGFGRGEKTSNFLSLNGSVSANRTTEAWKASLSVNGNYGQSRFELGDGTRYNSYSHSYGVSDLLVKSLGPHWSAGQRASWTSSTFLNQERAIRFAPAVEYNFFPYAQSTRRQLTIRYGPGISYFRYQDTTIFDRISEVRGDQTLTASLDLKQPWGSVSSSLEGAAYLHDPSKQHLIFFNSLDLRLFKGLSLFFFGQGSIIRDQLYLRRGNLSDTERLLRLRQLATSYSYFANVGLSYSFGSIFNNIVNSRFGGSSGGFMFFN